MSNRIRPQVSFNLDKQVERTLYEKIVAIDPNFSNAAKHIFFAYFFPPGGNQNQAQMIPTQNTTTEPPEEQFEELEGLPVF